MGAFYGMHIIPQWSRFLKWMGRNYRRVYLLSSITTVIHAPRAIGSFVSLALNCFSAGKRVNERVGGTMYLLVFLLKQSNFLWRNTMYVCVCIFVYFSLLLFWTRFLFLLVIDQSPFPPGSAQNSESYHQLNCI